MSKLFERYVTRCLIKHLTDNKLLERYQSTYKSHHYMETALVLVQNDILEALDRRHGVILVLLDMSAVKLYSADWNNASECLVLR